MRKLITINRSNLECICFSDRYQRSVESCIQDVCPDELGTVVTLMTAQCAEIHGPSSSGMFNYYFYLHK